MIKQYYAIIMQSYKIKNRKKNEGRIIFRCVLKILFLGYLQVRKYIGLLTRAKTKRLLVIEALL